MNTYAFPVLGEMAVSAVDEAAVMSVLAPIWLTKPDPATRLRQRIPNVIDWAVAYGIRQASLSLAKIDEGLPLRAAMPKRPLSMRYDSVPAFMVELRRKETIGRLALEVLILTAGRICDVRAMQWAEIDLDEKLWRVPMIVGRGRAVREHIVPLSNAAIDVLERAKKFTRGDTDLVFRGVKRGKQLSDNTLWKVALAMGYAITAQGFRITFADWAYEKSTFPGELVQAALAHTNPNKVEGSYSVFEDMDERRRLMEAWARHCLG
jgi:integrase